MNEDGHDGQEKKTRKEMKKENSVRDVPRPIRPRLISCSF